MSAEHGLSLADFVAHVVEFARVCGSAERDGVREWGRTAVERASGWAEYVQSTAGMLRDPREAAVVDRWIVEQLAQAAGAEGAESEPPTTHGLTVDGLAGRDGDAGGATSLLLRTLVLNPDTPSEVVRVALQHALRPAAVASEDPGSADLDEETQEARVVTALLHSVRERAKLRLVQGLLLDSSGGRAVGAQREAAVAAAEHGARAEPAASSALVTARAVALALSDRASRAPLKAVNGFFHQPELFTAQPKLLEAAAWLASGALRDSMWDSATARSRVTPLPLLPAQSADGSLQRAALGALRRAVADAGAAGSEGGAAGGIAGGGVAAAEGGATDGKMACAGGAANGGVDNTGGVPSGGQATAVGGVAAEVFSLHPQLLAFVCAVDAAESSLTPQPLLAARAADRSPGAKPPVLVHRVVDSSPAAPTLLAAYLQELRRRAVDLCGEANAASSGETDRRRGESGGGGGGGGGIAAAGGQGLGKRLRYVSSRPDLSSSVSLRASDWRGLAERWRWLWEVGCGGQMRPHLEREMRRAEGADTARLLAAGLRGALRRRMVVTDELGLLLVSCAATGAGSDEMIREMLD
jgi:hypothetical protein